jgi:hypothetical protein
MKRRRSLTEAVRRRFSERRGHAAPATDPAPRAEDLTNEETTALSARQAQRNARRGRG